MSEKKQSEYSKQTWTHIAVPKYLTKKIKKLIAAGAYISIADFVRSSIRHYLTEFHPQTMKDIDIIKKNNGKDIISLEGLEED